MRVLIIGANGFLGRNICKTCLDSSFNVAALYHKNKDKIPTQVKAFSEKELESLPENYDVVFLAAGNFTYPPAKLLEVNVVLTQRVVKKFIKSRIVFISSTSVYGVHKKVINISSSFNQPSEYGRSKLAGEFIAKTHKNASIIRFTALYGSGMNNNLFLPKIIKGALRKKVIRIFGDGKRRQDYVYVKDAASLCLLVAKHRRADTFLGAYGKSFSNNQIARIVKSLVPGTKIIHVGKDETPNLVFNVTETKNELGFSPEYSPREGLKEMLKNE